MEINLDLHLEEVSTWAVSFADLVNQKVYLDWAQSQDTTALENSTIRHTGDQNMFINYLMPDTVDLKNMLYDLGMDKSKGHLAQLVLHRTWKGNIVYGYRWVGEQRQDEEWLQLIKNC